MKRVYTLSSIASFMFLISCTSVPVTQELINSADFGERPTEAMMVSIIKEQVNSGTYYDPDSAKIKCTTPRKGWSRRTRAIESVRYGFLTTCSINAKNRLGGYTGYKDQHINYNDGHIVRYDQMDSGDYLPPYIGSTYDYVE